jgi:hypothetical protein
MKEDETRRHRRGTILFSLGVLLLIAQSVVAQIDWQVINGRDIALESLSEGGYIINGVRVYVISRENTVDVYDPYNPSNCSDSSFSYAFDNSGIRLSTEVTSCEVKHCALKQGFAMQFYDPAWVSYTFQVQPSVTFSPGVPTCYPGTPNEGPPAGCSQVHAIEAVCGPFADGYLIRRGRYYVGSDVASCLLESGSPVITKSCQVEQWAIVSLLSELDTTTQGLNFESSVSFSTRLTILPTPPVGPEPPTASFTIEPPEPVAGETVTFTSTSTDSDGQIVKYEWDFGDGTSAEGGKVTFHRF